ncbi:peptidylprolyl isomerase [Candidatus Omnitrophota bacterium]
MLKILRSKKTAKKIWITLAIIIIPAFCLWGLGSVMRDRKNPSSLGKVFGSSVSVQQYLKNYRATRNQYLIRLGQEQFGNLEKYLDLEAQTWERIILLAAARQKKIRVADQEVVDAIKQYPFFQNGTKFSPDLYRDTITYFFRTSPRQFEEETRDNLIIAKLYSQITNQVMLSETETKEAYEKANEEISLEYAGVQYQDFLDQVTATDQELLEFYNEHFEQFSKPLSFNLEYLRIEKTDKQKSDEIADSLKEGISLKQTAEKNGLETKETGFFSVNQPVPGIGWSTEILDLLPKLKADGKAWSAPIQADAEAMYFVGLKERKEPHTPPFEEVREEVRKMLLEQKASKIAEEKLGVFREEAKASGFTAAAGKLNLKVAQTQLFKRQGYVDGLGDSDIFFEAIKNLGAEETSSIINTPSGFYVVKLKERIKPGEEEFAEKKEEFAENLLEQKRQGYFNRFLAELKNKPNTFYRPISSESSF